MHHQLKPPWRQNKLPVNYCVTKVNNCKCHTITNKSLCFEMVEGWKNSSDHNSLLLAFSNSAIFNWMTLLSMTTLRKFHPSKINNPQKSKHGWKKPVEKVKRIQRQASIITKSKMYFRPSFIINHVILATPKNLAQILTVFRTIFPALLASVHPNGFEIGASVDNSLRNSYLQTIDH